MAEINVQQRRTNTWVWWVVAIAALALLTWWLFARDPGRTGIVPGEVTEPVPTVPADTVAPFGTAPLDTAAPFGTTAPPNRTHVAPGTPGTTTPGSPAPVRNP